LTDFRGNDLICGIIVIVRHCRQGWAACLGHVMALFDRGQFKGLWLGQADLYGGE
jgi:hypothetical protein